MGVAAIVGIGSIVAGGSAAHAVVTGAVVAVPLEATQTSLRATGTTTGQVSQLLAPTLDERISPFGRFAIPGAGTPMLSPGETEATIERITPAGPVAGEVCDDDLADCQADASRWHAASGALTAGPALARTTRTADAFTAESGVENVDVDLAKLFPGLSAVIGVTDLATVAGAASEVTTGKAATTSVTGLTVLGQAIDTATTVPTTERSVPFTVTDPALVLSSLVGPEDGVAYAGYVTAASLTGSLTVRVEKPVAADGAGSALALTVDAEWTVDIDSVIGTIDAHVEGELLNLTLASYALDAEGVVETDLQTVGTAARVQHSEVPASGLITGGAFAQMFNAELENTEIGGTDRIAFGEVGTPESDPGEKTLSFEEETPLDGLAFIRLRVANALGTDGATSVVESDGLAVSAPLVAEDDIASAVYGLDEIVTVDSISSTATAPRDTSVATDVDLDVEGLEVLGQPVVIPADFVTPIVVTRETEATDVDALIAALFGEEILDQAPGLRGNLTGSAQSTVTATISPSSTREGGSATAALTVDLSVDTDFQAIGSGAATMYMEKIEFTAAGSFAQVVLAETQAGRDGSLVEPVTPEEPGEQPDETWAIPTAEPSRILLSLTENPEESIAVTWRTDASVASGAVEVRPAGEVGALAVADARTVAAASGDPITFPTWTFTSRAHSAVIDGLSPATEYEYRVGAGDGWSEWYSFTTATDGDAFTFLAFGDAQNDLTPGFTPVAQTAFEAVPEAAFALHAGDLINNSDRDVQWGEWFRAQQPYTATIPTLTTPGNHEYSGDAALTNYHEHVTQPLNGPQPTATDPYTRAFEERIAAHLAESVYYVDHGGVRVISLDDNVGSGVTEFIPPVIPPCTIADCESAIEIFLRLQGEWLARVLEENPNTWSIVTFHQPVFSTSEGRDNALMRDAWLPILEAHDVDLVLMGHDHSYGRGHLIENETETPGLSTGPVYAVSVSGPKMYELSPEGDNVWTRNDARQVTRAGNTQGYQIIDVTDTTIRYRAVVALKQDGSTVPEAVGETFDEFTITRYADGTKWVSEVGVAVPADTSGPGVDPGDGDSVTPTPAPVAAPVVPRSERLATTGVDLLPVLPIAGLLLALGAALVVVRRRRRA